MEHSQFTNDGYFSQLETIKNIENNLSQIKSRIQYMQKEESRKLIQYQKTFTSSIPIIKSKISQHQHIIKVKNVKTESQHQQLQKIEEIRMSKLDNQCEISRNKLDIYKSKVYDAMNIREISKKNQKVIEEARQKWLAEKKKKSELVKMKGHESRKKILEFHVQKQSQLKKQKNQEKANLERRINNIQNNLTKMVRVEEKEQKNYRTQAKLLYKLKDIVSYMNAMRPQQFSQIIQALGLSKSSSLDQLLVEKVLQEVEKRKSNMQPQNRLIATNRTNNNRHFKSQSVDVIYGRSNTNFRKKIR